MTFQQIKYVVEIARWGSINKAAANLFISQSNISNAVKELEAELGITIFTRTNRGVLVTDRGREFISFISPLLEQKEKIDDFYMSRFQERPKLTFNVSSQRYPFTVKAFIKFLKDRPEDRFEAHIKETDMYQVIDDVFNNKSDVGIIFLSDMTEKFIAKVLKSKAIEFNVIKKVHPRAFLRKNHPLGNRETIEISELAKFPYVAFGQEKGVALDYAEEIPLVDFARSEKLIIIHDRATAYNIIANSDSYSIGTGIIPDGFCDERITTIPLISNSQSSLEMKIGWIKPKGKQADQKVDQFLEYLIEEMNC